MFVPYRLQYSLSVFGRLQSDLLSDDVSVLSLHASSSFRLRLHAQHLVLVSQLHLVLDGCYGNRFVRDQETCSMMERWSDTHLSSWPPASVRTPLVCAGSPRSAVAADQHNSAGVSVWQSSGERGPNQCIPAVAAGRRIAVGRVYPGTALSVETVT